MLACADSSVVHNWYLLSKMNHNPYFHLLLCNNGLLGDAMNHSASCCNRHSAVLLLSKVSNIVHSSGVKLSISLTRFCLVVEVVILYDCL